MTGAGSDPTAVGPGSDRLPWTTRFGLGTLLCLTMGAGPYVLYAVSALAPLITRDLGLTRTSMGALITISFVIATLLSASSGAMTDRLGDRRTLYLLHGCTAAAMLLLTVGTSYAWLVAATALAGVSQSIANPVTNRLVARNVPIGRRGTLLGVKQSGVQMAQFVAGAALPTIAILLGWRGSVTVSLLFIVVALLATRRYVAARRPSVGAGRTPLDLKVPAVVVWLGAFGFLMGIVMQGVNMYLPLFSYEALGFTPQWAGAIAGVVGILGVVGKVLWGQRAERTKTPVVPMVIIGLLSMIAIVSLVIAESGGPGWLWSGVALFALGALATPAVLMMALVRAVPAHTTGKASGQVMVGVYSGFMAGPILVGVVVDRVGRYAEAWWVMFACSALATCVALVWRHRLSTQNLEPSP